MMKVIAFIPCRNEAANLSKVLDQLVNQTLPYSDIIVINDASTDQTKSIAKSYDVILFDLTDQHESYLGKPELAKIFNYAFDIIQDYDLPCDYIMQLGGDTLIPLNYNEEIVKRMGLNNKIVIAGGVVEGELQYETHVRGNGRYYQAEFWFNHVERYPLNFTWESYPLYLARALGFEIKNYPELIMQPLRPTNFFKGQYGHAMRELGYFPPYALGRCLLSFLLNQREGMSMLINYLRSPYSRADPLISGFIRHHQIQRIMHPKESLNIWTSRL